MSMATVHADLGPSQPGTTAATAPVGQVEPWHGARALPTGPWHGGQEWMRRAACRAPGVDPDWFTTDEDAPGAGELIAKAKQVCRTRCPVRLWCRIHADQTGEYGVYAAETHSERVRRQRAWRQAVTDAEAAEQAVSA